MFLPKCGQCRRTMRLMHREGEFVEVRCKECGTHAFALDTQ